MVISCCFLLCCCWRSLKVRKLWQRSRCARRSHKMQNRTTTTTTRENAAQCNLISARQKSHQKVEWKKSNKYLTLLCDFAFCIANAKKNGVDCSWKRQKDRYRPAVSCGGGSITTTALPDYIVYAVDSERGRAKQQDRYRPAVSCGGGSITKAALPDRRALHCLRSYISFAVATNGWSLLCRILCSLQSTCIVAKLLNNCNFCWLHIYGLLLRRAEVLPQTTCSLIGSDSLPQRSANQLARN